MCESRKTRSRVRARLAMRRGLLAVTLAAAGLSAHSARAQSFTDCSGAATQLAATECAHNGWQRVDDELNRLWKVVKPAADKRGQGRQLLQAQRAWLKYRDATCEGERDQYKGGSIADQIYWSCMDRLTRVRNRELKAMN